MKKSVVVLLGTLAVASGFAQELVRNPEKALNPEAGRVLKLEPVFEISDASGEFYFKYPHKFQLDDKGRLYILDEDQLLQFTSDGKFVRNFYRKGQGPGEISTGFQMVSFVCSGSDIYVYDGIGMIMRFDQDGNFVGDVKQTAGRFFGLIGITENGYFMRGQSRAPMGGPAGFMDVESQIYLVSLDGSSAEKIIGFTSRIYQGPNFGMDWDNFMQAFNKNDGSIYVSHTCEYKVVRAVLPQGTIVTSFTRDYRRIKFSVPKGLESFYEKHDPPKKDFENDISEIFINDMNVWVRTSTSDKNRGRLFDVFDPRGRFLDSFFLGVNGGLALADGDFIYTTENDPEENILIRKHRILNGTR
jgi:hypothetical protein